jgi:hypothetical protein
VFNATLQRCRVHWMRNAVAHVPANVGGGENPHINGDICWS